MPNPQNETLDNMDVGRAQRFSENEVKVLVHEVKARQARIYGTASRPTRREDAKQAWVEVAMAVSSFSGIHRTVDQVKKKFDSTKRSGRRKAEANRKEQLAMGGSGQAMVQVLTPAEDLAASTLFPESIYYDIVEVQVGGPQGEQCVESRLQVKMNSPDDSARDFSMKHEIPLDISIKQEEPEDHPHLTHGHLLHPGRGGVHVPEGFGHLLQEQTLRPTPGEKQGFFPPLSVPTDGPLDQQTPIDHTWATGGPGATCGPHYHLMRPADLPAEEEETDWEGTGAERAQQHPSAGGTSAAALAAEREGSRRPKRPRPLEEDPGEGTSARRRRRLGNNAHRPEEDRPPPTGFRMLERELGGLRRGLRGVNLAVRRGLAAMARHERLLGRGVAALERSAAALESLASLQRPLAPPPPTAAPTAPDPEP